MIHYFLFNFRVLFCSIWLWKRGQCVTLLYIVQLESEKDKVLIKT